MHQTESFKRCLIAIALAMAMLTWSTAGDAQLGGLLPPPTTSWHQRLWGTRAQHEYPFSEFSERQRQQRSPTPGLSAASTTPEMLPWLQGASPLRLARK